MGWGRMAQFRPNKPTACQEPPTARAEKLYDPGKSNEALKFLRIHKKSYFHRTFLVTIPMYSSNLPLVVYSRFVRPTYHGFARSEVMDLCVTRRIGRVGQVEVQWFGRYSKSTLCVEIKAASCLLGSEGREPSIGDCLLPSNNEALGKTPNNSLQL